MVEFDIIGTEKEKITINRLYGIYGKDSTNSSKLLIIGGFVAVRNDEGQKKCCSPRHRDITSFSAKRHLPRQYSCG